MLNEKLKGYDQAGISSLMNVSSKLADETFSEIQNFGLPGNSEGPALLSYSGTVFQHLDALSLNPDQWSFAVSRVRILSGLYGYLNPSDRISPYRLEMKTPLGLYAFWKEKISDALAAENLPVLNLASGEYSKAVDWKKIGSPVLSIQFKEEKNNRFRTVGMYSKMARGILAGRIIRDRIENWDDLKNLDMNGYRFNESLSTDSEWIFTGNWRR